MQPAREHLCHLACREVLVAAAVAGCACKKIMCVRLDLDQLSDHAKEDACVKGLQMLHPRGHCS